MKALAGLKKLDPGAHKPARALTIEPSSVGFCPTSRDDVQAVVTKLKAMKEDSAPLPVHTTPSSVLINAHSSSTLPPEFEKLGETIEEETERFWPLKAEYEAAAKLARKELFVWGMTLVIMVLSPTFAVLTTFSTHVFASDPNLVLTASDRYLLFSPLTSQPYSSLLFPILFFSILLKLSRFHIGRVEKFKARCERAETCMHVCA